MVGQPMAALCGELHEGSDSVRGEVRGSGEPMHRYLKA